MKRKSDILAAAKREMGYKYSVPVGYDKQHLLPYPSIHTYIYKFTK
jgi:hypothetical protein